MQKTAEGEGYSAKAGCIYEEEVGRGEKAEREISKEGKQIDGKTKSRPKIKNQAKGKQETVSREKGSSCQVFGQR